MKAAAAHLLSRDMIVNNPKVPVLVFMDIKVAIFFREAAREARILTRTGVIVSAVAGGEDAQKGLC